MKTRLHELISRVRGVRLRDLDPRRIHSLGFKYTFFCKDSNDTWIPRFGRMYDCSRCAYLPDVWFKVGAFDAHLAWYGDTKPAPKPSWPKRKYDIDETLLCKLSSRLLPIKVLLAAVHIDFWPGRCTRITTRLVASTSGSLLDGRGRVTSKAVTLRGISVTDRCGFM